MRTKANKKPYLFLFDIDGTLLSTNRSGVNSFLRAFDDVYFPGKKENINHNVPFAGSSDRTIFHNLAGANSRAGTEKDWNKFKKKYHAYLLKESKHKTGWRLYDGVMESLTFLNEHTYLALLTGNIKMCADIKLSALLVNHFFPIGGFADDGFSRNDIAVQALKKANSHYNMDFQPESVWVVGDTPHDITCARYIKAKVIAVATGMHTLSDLQQNNPDIAVTNLSTVDFKRIISL